MKKLFALSTLLLILSSCISSVYVNRNMCDYTDRQYVLGKVEVITWMSETSQDFVSQDMLKRYSENTYKSIPVRSICKVIEERFDIKIDENTMLSNYSKKGSKALTGGRRYIVGAENTNEHKTLNRLDIIVALDINVTTPVNKEFEQPAATMRYLINLRTKDKRRVLFQYGSIVKTTKSGNELYSFDPSDKHKITMGSIKFLNRFEEEIYKD